MIVPRLIERKRSGDALAPGEWTALIDAYHAGRVPDYQMSALLMAVCFRGLATAELAELLDAMIGSGARIDRSGITAPMVDKHSTGGVGDKTSLVLAPLAAACGVAVPMMSGRGLGHTGGTLDKLEAIPGFRTRLTLREAEAQLARLGCVMLGQTEEIAPVDKRLYALRDVTGTVESIPLISASIMSKKLAESLDGLVLDVKTGSGAFLPDPALARELAETMVALGTARGCRVVALLTAMDRPLGREIGNALEVKESLEVLEGGGPHDLLSVTFALADEMLLLAGVAADRAAARAAVQRAIASGAARERFGQMIEAQGGDRRVLDTPDGLAKAPLTFVVEAERDGIVTRIEPRRIGRALVEMGGGRRTVDDAVDPAVGFTLRVTTGDVVLRGRPLAVVHARDEAGLAAGCTALAEAVAIGEEASPAPLVSARVTAAGTTTL